MVFSRVIAFPAPAWPRPQTTLYAYSKRTRRLLSPSATGVPPDTASLDTAGRDIKVRMAQARVALLTINCQIPFLCALCLFTAKLMLKMSNPGPSAGP